MNETSNFRATSLNWGENTMYTLFPAKSPFEELVKYDIEDKQLFLKPFTDFMYKPVNTMCEVLVRP